MKILYAIQGTGNGHLSRAIEIIPHLRRRAQVDLLVSGTASEITLPCPIRYYYKGISLEIDKKGGISYLNTYAKNHLTFFLRDVKRLPIEQYDLIVNDFEPISAWAAWLKKKPCVALSNQCALLSDKTPHPEKDDKLGRFVLRNYAPASLHYGLHFARYDDNIFTPVIRGEVRKADVKDLGHYTVYLPSYSDERIIKHLSVFSEIKWEVFSKKCLVPTREGNIFFHPIENESFLNSMATSTGVLCGAGFSTPSEALFLQKKLLVIPMKMQYEQQCNAAALSLMGVPVIPSLKKKHHEIIGNWLNYPMQVPVFYPDNASQIINTILENHSAGSVYRPQTVKEFALAMK